MTILNDFAKAADIVAESLGKYFGTRDSSELGRAIEVLQDQIASLQREITDPTLQETVVTLTRMSGADVLDVIGRDNALRLANEDYLADGPLTENMLLRVKPADQEDGAVYLTKVTMVTMSMLVLAPVVVG